MRRSHPCLEPCFCFISNAASPIASCRCARCGRSALSPTRSISGTGLCSAWPPSSTAAKHPPPCALCCCCSPQARRRCPSSSSRDPSGQLAQANPSRVLLAYGCVIAAAVLAASTLLLTRGVSRRTPQLAQIETAAAVNRSHVCINYPDNGPDLSSYCVPPAAGTPAVALLGDSHAEAVESTLRGLVDASHQQLVVLAAYACPPFQGVTRLLPGSPGHAENCAAFNQQALSLVASRPDIRTVVLCGSWGMLPTDAFPITAAADDVSTLSPEQNKINVIRGLGAEVHALESAGKRVLLIDDWPDLTIDPLERARYAALPARRILAGWLLGHPVEDTRSDNLPAAQVLSPAAKAVRSELLRMAATDPEPHRNRHQANPLQSAILPLCAGRHPALQRYGSHQPLRRRANPSRGHAQRTRIVAGLKRGPKKKGCCPGSTPCDSVLVIAKN